MTDVATRNHAKFLQHLDSSEAVRWRIAQWLAERGNTVSIPPVRRAEAHSEWKQNTDDGDLHIVQRVEVKKLSVNFTCSADWPYRDKFIVCAKHAFDRAKPKPFAFIIVSACQEYAAVVFSENSKSWTVDQRKDSRYENIAQEFYFSPLSLVQWVRL